MTVKTSWPWISSLAAVAFAVSPFGTSIARVLLYSGEQLARTLNLFVLEIVIGILAAFALIEFGIRKYLISRQRRMANGAHHG